MGSDLTPDWRGAAKRDYIPASRPRRRLGFCEEVPGMRVRLFALVSALALFVLAAVPASASSEGLSYLALGDSVAFGFNPLLVAGGQAGNPNVFVGYPEVVAKTLDTEEVNASCPGETTGGFISLTNGADYKCQAYRSAFPLHVDYSTSQLDFAIRYLSTHPDVELVTMDIGANDVFKLQAACGGAATACFLNGLSAVLANIDANLRFIYGQLRNVAHYHHTLVTLTYYSLSYDPTTAAGTDALNGPIIDATLAFGGIVASGFEAFKGPALDAGGSSCAAGLLIVLAPGVCDVHPSPLGRDRLAAAIVNAIAQSQT
jgi:lysophospholipase L1-like esterase